MLKLQHSINLTIDEFRQDIKALTATKNMTVSQIIDAKQDLKHTIQEVN